ncbi:MAG: O-antigen ligase family protein [Desulfoprunum sp.]
MAHVPLHVFTLALIFAPLAFGTVEHWSITTLELLVGAAALLYFGITWISRQQHLAVPGFLPLLLLLALMVVQIVPLPPAVLKVLSPHAFAAYVPVADLADQGRWLPISLNQKATIQELFRISSCAMAYILTIQLLNAPVPLKKTTNFVIFLAVGIAFLAILQQVSSPDRIYWFRTVPENAHPFGPWVNPNQFAGYIEMISPLALALFLFYKPRIDSDQSWRERFVALFTQPEANRYFYYGFGSILLVLAVFVSLCRGGIISVTLACMAFIVLYGTKKQQRGRLTLMMLICFAFLAVSWFGWDLVVAEFRHGFDSEGRIRDARLTLWRDSLAIVKDYPLLGSGFGTFQQVYPRYKSLTDTLSYNHAHNDYLELLTDGGLAGFLLASWFVLAVLRHGWRMVRARRDHYAVLVGIGAISGIFAMLMHGITDFNMHNGAVGLYFFFLCGLLVAAVNVRFNYAAQESLLAKLPIRHNGVFVLLSGCLFGVILIVQSGVGMARAQYSEVRKVYLSGRLAADRLVELAERLEKAMGWDPLEGLYPFTMGTVQWFLTDDRNLAQRYYLLAALDSPMEGAFLQRLGFFLTDEEKGGQLIREGYARAQNKDELAVSLAEWLLSKDRREEAGTVIRERLQARPQLMGVILPLLEHYSFDRKEIAGILPPSVEAWLRFGEMRERMGDVTGAEFYTGRALELLARDNRPKPGWFQQIISFYQAHGDEGRSQEVLRQAIEAFPDHASFHVQLGRYYEKEGIIYRAKEEFERALMLEPANQTAQRSLRRLGFADSY